MTFKELLKKRGMTQEQLALDIRGKVSTAVYLDYFEPKTNEVVKEERKERVVASKKIRTKKIPPFRFKDYQGVQQ